MFQRAGRGALVAATLAFAMAIPAVAQIKVAYIDPLSGPFANVGEQQLQHFLLAAEQINAKGGVLGQKIEVLRGHCEALGRDINEIAISTTIMNAYLVDDGADPAKLPDWVGGTFTPELYRQNVRPVTADQLASEIEACIGAGANYVLVYLYGLAYDQTPLRRFAQEVMPRFA